MTELMTVSNVTRSASPANSEASQVTTEDADNEVDTPPALRSPEGQVKNCKRKRGPQWMENAATALANLASTAQEVEEEWDIFGKDVAMTIRNMDVAQRKKAKFSVQQALYMVEVCGSANPLPQQPAHFIGGSGFLPSCQSKHCLLRSAHWG